MAKKRTDEAAAEMTALRTERPKQTEGAEVTAFDMSKAKPTRPRNRAYERVRAEKPRTAYGAKEISAAINTLNAAHVRPSAVDDIAGYLTTGLTNAARDEMSELRAEFRRLMATEDKTSDEWDRVNAIQDALDALYNSQKEKVAELYPTPECAAEWAGAVRLCALRTVQGARGTALKIMQRNGWSAADVDALEARAFFSTESTWLEVEGVATDDERAVLEAFSNPFLHYHISGAWAMASRTLRGCSIDGQDAWEMALALTALVLRNKWTAAAPAIAEPAGPVRAKRGTVAKEIFLPLDKWTRTMTAPSKDRDRLYKTGVAELVTGDGLRSRATLECYSTDGALLIPSPDLIMRYGLTGFDAAVYSALLTIVDMHERAGIPLAEYKHIPLSRIWRQMCPPRHGEKARVATKAQLKLVSDSLMKLNALRPGIACPLYVSKTGRPLGGASFPRMVEMAPALLEIGGQLVPGIELYRVPISYDYTMGLQQLDRVTVGVIAELPNSYTYAGIGIRYYLLSLIVYGNWREDSGVYAPYKHLYQQAGVTEKDFKAKNRAIKTAKEMLSVWIKPTNERDAVLTDYQADYMGDDGKGLWLQLTDEAES